MLVKNGHIITCDANDTSAEAMIIRNGKIEAIGSNDEMASRSDSDEKVLDLKGRTVLPGFIDSHAHMTQTGLNKFGVKIDDVRSVQEMLDAISRHMSEEKSELIFGIGYDDAKMVDKRPPTIDELDAISTEKFIWMGRIDAHSCVVNTKMLEHLEIPEGTLGVDLDENGKPTGVLRARANSHARKIYLEMISDKMRAKALHIAAEEALSQGVTTLGALEGGPLFNDRDFYFLETIQDELPLDVEPYFQTTDVDLVIEKGLNRMGGCIILDGSFGSRTAALAEPYADDPSTSGVLYHTQEKVDAMVLKAHTNGIQLAFHALGERAIEQVLQAYEKAIAAHPRQDHRHRIEHYELPTQDQIERSAKIGVVISVQPAFEHHWGGPDGMYAKRLGVERAESTQPYKAILDAGCLMVGGSDSDVTPISPLVGIHGAVNRTRDDIKISPADAIRMFTINGAKVVFKEDVKGSLEEGKLGDFVVLSDNPMTVPSETIKDIKVEMTVKEGEVAYTA